MKRPRQRRTKAGKQAESATLRGKDKLLIIGGLIAALTAIFAFEHFYWTRKATSALEKRLGQWERRYHLTGDQVNRLRTIERAHSLLLRQTMGLEAQPTAGSPALESR